MREVKEGGIMGKWRRRAVAALIAPVLILAVAWCAGALWFDGPASRWQAGLLAAGFLLACLAIAAGLRPPRRAAFAVAFAVLFVAAWWIRIPPSNDRDWQRDVALLPTAELSGSRLTVHNVRNFDYRSETDYIERWETRSYDLDALQGIDIFLCYWGPTLIAHTIVSWEFADGSRLAASIETRKEAGESYSAVRGFFRQFEIYYVLADERDVVRLRTNHRGERVFLYRMKATPTQARALLLEYVAEINGLARRPRWYNALTNSCTTAIRHHAQRIQAANPWDWRILANGLADRMSYERGSIDTSLPFEELRRRSEVTERARAAGQAPDFSRRIRVGLPGKGNRP
ncbi:MAG: hypothetical protein H6Q84_2684 [Deltaproteobacteria bacterium]|nr:hypothetical protein [Deltaproteobacteria bacterium]